jgi:hypothetical protein
VSVDSSSAALGPGWAEEKSRFIFLPDEPGFALSITHLACIQIPELSLSFFYLRCIDSIAVDHGKSSW